MTSATSATSEGAQGFFFKKHIFEISLFQGKKMSSILALRSKFQSNLSIEEVCNEIRRVKICLRCQPNSYEKKILFFVGISNFLPFFKVLVYIEGDAQNLPLINHHFTILSSHFFGIYIHIFQKTEIQTVISGFYQFCKKTSSKVLLP